MYSGIMESHKIFEENMCNFSVKILWDDDIALIMILIQDWTMIFKNKIWILHFEQRYRKLNAGAV